MFSLFIQDNAIYLYCQIKTMKVMKKFVVDFNGGDSYVIEAKSAREAARMVRAQGKNLLKYNEQSSMYFIWDEAEENILYTVQTFRVEKRMHSVITNCRKNN